MDRLGFRALWPDHAPLDDRAQLLAGLLEVGMPVYEGPQDDPADGPRELFEVVFGGLPGRPGAG